jgi:hypothetical protein
VRQLIKFAVNSRVKESSRGGLSKLLVALKWYNMHASEPIIARED